MEAAKRLLVVDDEDVICQSCRRIFEPQGFCVETSTDSQKGLGLARSQDYVAILLDVKMPDLEGLEFLECLRKDRPQVPVVMITGYSSVPSAAAAMRLGASDYIPKPFTPDELTAAIRRLIGEPLLAPGPETAPAVVPDKEWLPMGSDILFLGEGWMRPGQDGTFRAGAFFTHDEVKSIGRIDLPKLGDKVYAGLPLASITVADGARRMVPSAVSGEVLEVNGSVGSTDADKWDNPCEQGWLVRVRPSAREQDERKCRPRRVLLAIAADAPRTAQCEQLAWLGCKVRVAVTTNEAVAALKKGHADVVFVDAASWGEQGPGLVKQVNAIAPAVKVVVLGDSNGKHEGEYRSSKITYYAVAPFEDHEIVDILAAAFAQPLPQVPVLSGSSVLPRTVSKIRITNRKRERICLLSTGEALRADRGLGLQVIHDLLGGAYPIQVTYGRKVLDAAELQAESADNDRILVLLAEDQGRLPGSLSVGASSRSLTLQGDAAAKTTVLLVQPAETPEGGFQFDGRTTLALAEQIVAHMSG